MKTWRLWEKGEVIREISDFIPQLASWEKNDHPSQVRLRKYLDHLMLDLGSIPSMGGLLFAHLTVDVQRKERLLHHYDLENYLTPLFGPHGLDAINYRLVSATKQLGGGSNLRVGIVLPMARPLEDDGWNHFSYEAGSGSSSPRWKHSLKNALAQANPDKVAPGPAAVHLAWRCSSKRNWVNLWKPTGDALGPVLGEETARGSFNPHDDRIVSLTMHLQKDETLGNNVEVGMWWHPAE